MCVYVHTQWNNTQVLKEGKYDACYNMDDLRRYAKWNKPGTNGQILYDFTYMHACLVTQTCWLSATPWTVTHQVPVIFQVHRISQARILEWVAIAFSITYIRYLKQLNS